MKSYNSNATPMGMAVAILMGVSLLIMAGGCSGKDKSANPGAVETVTDLPLPAIPDSITDPARRAAYAALHWWDTMDFRNHRLSLDTAFMEQNFSNFVMVLSGTDTVSVRQSVDRLLERAEADSGAWRLLAHVTEKYLYDPNSPYRSDELYIPFLREYIASPLEDDGRRERDSFRLEMALRNRVGAVATDFRFVTRQGQEMSLHGLAADKPVLLIFYNPDCESCETVISRLRQEPLSQKFLVLAVDAESDRGLWQRTAGEMPQDWTVGYALTTILDQDLYDLKASPTIYILNPDMTVMAKDISPAILTEP